ncbi:sugar phosphate isomerase/epimerase family protein [Actinomadura rudentiformis]|uniref:Sugar phosphate isomerase/epimerase n=1 Tax=Actinomadura rudentiformis TaxID=359158 RepID=A0A6H9Z7R9_9ACTN|nr:sugar phosphate isomerase/epimerase [Actinomadura rudentiformis]KAB2352396.1 sugar phosphate isomerase/epimerase [Actinomadura rudentiformis]
MSEINRRTLLGGVAATAAGLGVAALPGSAAASTTAPHRHRRVPRGGISIQLYTLRSLLAADLEGTLAALARIGYRKVELAGLHGRTPAEFRAILDRYGLSATSSHVGIDGDWQKTLADARTLGNRFVVAPFAQFATAGEWRDYASRLNAAGKAARAAGLRFGYHNHAHEFQALPTGERPWDIITATDRRLVHLELDLYWAVTGGQDPVDLIRRNRGRILQFHCKDRAADGSFTDLGTGTIDFRRIFSHSREAGVLEYIVERDTQPDPLKTAQVGFDYLRTVRFGCR